MASHAFRDWSIHQPNRPEYYTDRFSSLVEVSDGEKAVAAILPSAEFAMRIVSELEKRRDQRKRQHRYRAAIEITQRQQRDATIALQKAEFELEMCKAQLINSGTGMSKEASDILEQHLLNVYEAREDLERCNIDRKAMEEDFAKNTETEPSWQWIEPILEEIWTNAGILERLEEDDFRAEADSSLARNHANDNSISHEGCEAKAANKIGIQNNQPFIPKFQRLTNLIAEMDGFSKGPENSTNGQNEVNESSLLFAESSKNGAKIPMKKCQWKAESSVQDSFTPPGLPPTNFFPLEHGSKTKSVNSTQEKSEASKLFSQRGRQKTGFLSQKRKRSDDKPGVLSNKKARPHAFPSLTPSSKKPLKKAKKESTDKRRPSVASKIPIRKHRCTKAD